MTTIDKAVLANKSDDASALALYARLMESEMFMILEEEPRNEIVRPLVLDTSDCAVALIFDQEVRLAEFAGEPVPYLAFSGRKIVAMLAGQQIGLGINLGVADGETILSPAIIDWLNETANAGKNLHDEKPVEISAPLNLSENLIEAIDIKIATMSGVVSAAFLVGVAYEKTQKGYLLAMVGVPKEAQDGVAEAMSEAVLFSGIEAERLDITFLDLTDASIARFAKVGLSFEIPQMKMPEAPVASAPGMDPDRPPKLR